jgi:5-methylcytosine-specific restriction endonuclease McrA
MNDHIDKIRELLSDFEMTLERAPSVDRGFTAFELPQIVHEIVDDLQPLLTPYDAAFYWYLFRHSIAKDGGPRLRVSSRYLRTAVVKSSYSQAAQNTISLAKVQEILRALESIGAIRKEGEPNRQGTPYRVLIPDEIEACREYRAQRTEITQNPPSAPKPSDLDYYNVRENRINVFERDGYICRYCQKQLTRFTATLDHVMAVVTGGDNSLENLVTACLDCNSRKNKRMVGDFLIEE